MAEELIVSISGLRGIVGDNLTAPIAAEYGCAFGTFLKDTAAGQKKLSVCIGRDSRGSGEMLNSAVAAGLCSTGIDVVDLGIVSTPGVGVMVEHLGCNGGVIITASHNPIQYNGIKLLLNNSIAPPLQKAEQIKKYFLDKTFALTDSYGCGKVTLNTQTSTIHIDKVLALVDRNAICAKNFKVALDSVNGAGGPVGKKLLEELGCNITAVNNEPTGLFTHSPEPTAENLKDFCLQLSDIKPDVGFVQDPDADRLAIIDENGNYIGEEYTLALACKCMLSKTAGAKVATNLSTSRMIDDIAAQFNAELVRTAVGEANVAEAILKYNCIIGGEGNGGVIDPRVVPIRNSLIGIAVVLQLMAETGKRISELTADIGGYYMSKHKFKADKSQAEQIIEIAKKTFTNAKINTTDGCRFDFEDSWLHLRTSNTEPVMRLIVEAKDSAAAKKYIDTVTDIRKQVIGEC